MLFPHTRTKSTHGMLSCLKNWFCFIKNEIVRRSFPNCDWRRLNIRCFQRWNISGSLHMWKQRTKTVTKSPDEFQQRNELNGCNEKFKSKTDPQVSGNKRCRWIMKHGRRTRFDESWCGCGTSNPIINENSRTNTKRKNEQEHCLILFVEIKTWKLWFVLHFMFTT